MRILNKVRILIMASWMLGFMVSCEQPIHEKDPEVLLTKLGHRPNDPGEDLIRKVADHFGLPGITAAVINQDSILEMTAYGIADTRTGRRLTLDDTFDLNSISKSFTALIIMQLVEEGLLRLDDKVSKFFPRLEEEIHEDYQAITVLDLLSHTSGISKSGMNESDTIPPEFRGSLPDKREAFAYWALRRESNKTYGRFHFSDAGYVILGAIIQKLTRNSYEREVRQRIYGPLRLYSAGFGWPPDFSLDHAYGHLRVEDKVGPVRFEKWYLHLIEIPSGGIHMSMEDLAIYVREHLLGLSGRSELLSKGSYEQMHGINGDSGMGWFAGSLANVPGRESSGKGDGYRSEVFISGEKPLAVLVQTNINDENDSLACRTIQLALLQKYIGR